MITIEEMYLRNAISGNSSPQYEKVVEFPFQAHEIALVLIGVRSCHSSLLRTFGLNATSPYDSYLPLIFGNFALI